MKAHIQLFILSLLILISCKKNLDNSKKSSLEINNEQSQKTDTTKPPMLIKSGFGAITFISANSGKILKVEQQASDDKTIFLTQTPILINNRLIIFEDKYVEAVDMDSSTVIWKTKIGDGGDNFVRYFSSYPCVSDNFLLFTYGNRYSYKFFSIDLESGKIEWSHNLSQDLRNTTYFGGGPSGAACTKNIVMVPSNDTLYAFNVLTGDQVWRFNASDVRLSIFNPCIYNNNVYVAIHSNSEIFRDSIACLNIGNGKLIWSADVDHLAINPAPICDENRVLVNKTDGVACLDAITGSQLWNFKDIFTNNGFSPMYISSGKVFVLSDLYSDAELYSLSVNDGSKIWQVGPVDFYEWNTIGPIVMNNLVYVDGEMYTDAYDVSTGQLVWRVEDPYSNKEWAPTGVDKNGKLFFSSASGMY